MIKKFVIVFFIVYISLFPIISFFKEDDVINEIENKVLTQFISPNLNNIKNSKFMSNFENYISDQFPFRSEFIYLKNSFNYLIGNREFRNVYVSGNRLLGKFELNKDIVGKNIESMNDIMYGSNIKSDILIVPTAIAFYENELPYYIKTDNQKDFFKEISPEFIGNFHNIYDTLLTHKDEYIYFNTDHHWTQLGAKYAYEYIYDKKISSEYKKVASDFKGSYFSKALLPNVKGDDIFAYEEFNKFNISYDFNNSSKTLYDDSKLNGKNKYQYFLNGDPGYAIIDGSGSSEILVLKDSFGHNFIPMLAKDFKKIHVIDPRYYKSNILNYIKNNKGIDNILFIHGVETLNNDYIYKGNI